LENASARSKNMSAIRGKDTKPEMLVRRFLHSEGLRYRLHQKGLPGKPDLVFRRFQTVVFVHGCFWHRHKGCKNSIMPKNNRDFWKKKLESNVKRDYKNRTALTSAGWRVLVIWECEIDEKALDKLSKAIRGQSAK